MNTLNRFYTNLCTLFLFIFLALGVNNAQAQLEYTTITKNINPDAKGLYHDLSKKGDSLLLASQSIFYKVTFLNSMDRRVMKFNPPVLTAKIPLQDIVVGDYTVLVYTKDKIIVFHIARILEIEPQDALLAKVDLPAGEINEIASASTNIDTKELSIDTTVDITTDEIKVAMSDDVSNAVDLELPIKKEPYNLSSMKREGMQTREDYRRNNLRPNGKPYY